MKVILTGANGQLGSDIVKFLPNDINLISLTRNDLDLSNYDECKLCIKNNRPDWIINSGAYTAVDKAEKEPNKAFSVNADAPKAFSEALADFGGNLLQLSTDYVFNGNQCRPYLESQSRSPIGIYGRSKAKGEENIEQILGSTNQAIILRTSWVVGSNGKNFVLTMLGLHNNKKEISVVSDQIGCTSNTESLAKVCWEIIIKSINNNQNYINKPLILHWSDSGIASWYDVAVLVGEIGLELGLIKCVADVKPIMTKDYPTLAERPMFSLLDCHYTKSILSTPSMHWSYGVRTILKSFSKKSLT